MGKCVACGKSFALAFSSCADGKVCSDCAKAVPEVYDRAFGDLSAQDIENLKKHRAEEEPLRKKFDETSFYGSVHLDSHHGILVVCESDRVKPGDESALFIDMGTLSSFSFSMDGAKAKGASVEVDVHVSLDAVGIPEVHAYKIARDTCCTEFIEDGGGMMRYSYPVGAQVTWDEVVRVNHRLIEESEYAIAHCIGESVEYAKASGLFMIDDDNFTPELLRKRRNQLVKAFHSDAGGDDECAAKINKAYEILMEKCKR